MKLGPGVLLWTGARVKAGMGISSNISGSVIVISGMGETGFGLGFDFGLDRTPGWEADVLLLLLEDVEVEDGSGFGASASPSLSVALAFAVEGGVLLGAVFTFL